MNEDNKPPQIVSAEEASVWGSTYATCLFLGQALMPRNTRRLDAALEADKAVEIFRLRRPL